MVLVALSRLCEQQLVLSKCCEYQRYCNCVVVKLFVFSVLILQFFVVKACFVLPAWFTYGALQ